jgi:hypothetical protein
MPARKKKNNLSKAMNIAVIGLMIALICYLYQVLVKYKIMPPLPDPINKVVSAVASAAIPLAIIVAGGLVLGAGLPVVGAIIIGIGALAGAAVLFEMFFTGDIGTDRSVPAVRKIYKMNSKMGGGAPQDAVIQSEMNEPLVIG